MSSDRILDAESSPLYEEALGEDMPTPPDEEEEWFSRAGEDEYEAERLKDAGVAKALENEFIQEYVRKVETALRWFAAQARSGFPDGFTADDVTRSAGNPPNGKILGAIFSKWVKEGRIVATGYTKSTRPSSHGRVIRTYRGKR